MRERVGEGEAEQTAAGADELERAMGAGQSERERANVEDAGEWKRARDAVESGREFATGEGRGGRRRATGGADGGDRPGILVISHGSREAGWVAQVERAVEEARAKLPVGLPVEAAYLELVEGRLIQDGVTALEAQGVSDIYALPLFVSSGSTHVDEIGWALGAYPEPRRETDLEPIAVRARLAYGQPIGSDPEIARVLADKLAAGAREPAAEAVLLVGHGSDEPWFYEAWRRELEGLAAELVRVGGYAGAAAALLRPDETAAAIALLRTRHPGARLLAIPLFLSEGFFTSSAVPGRLAGQGVDYVQCALLPHPAVSDWIVGRVRTWLANRVAAGGGAVVE